MLLAAAWLAMAEVNRLVTEAATANGQSASAGSLLALDPRRGQQNWDVWATLPVNLREEVAALLVMFAVLNVAAAGGYVALLWRLFRGRRVASALLCLLAAAKLAEAILLVLGTGELRAAAGATGSPGAVQGPMIAVTWLKWGTLAAVLVAVLGYPAVRTAVFLAIRRAWRALFFQRLSVAVVVLIALLSLLPIPGVSDQLPDTQRAWAATGLASAHFWWTTAAVTVVGIGLFSLGRRRSQLAWDLYATGTPTPKLAPSYWWWALGPAAAAAVLLVVVLTGGTVNWPNRQFWLFLGTPAVLVAASLFLRTVAPRSGPVPPAPADTVRALDAWRCGDVLAILLGAVHGLALVRSFTAPVALALTRQGPAPVAIGWSPLFLALGWILALAVFPLGAFLIRLLADRALAPQRPTGPITRALALAAVAASTVALAWLSFQPVGFATLFGVSATAVLAIGSWSVVVGFLVVLQQRQRPLPVFERLGLRANPVLTLIVGVLVAGSLNGGDPRLHEVRLLPGAPAASRPDLQQRFDTWLAASSPCSRPLPVGPGTGAAQSVRPLVLVAAEGGGIRAAAWTARAFGKLAAGRCGQDAVLLSSGVSGGSLGLALTRLYGASNAGAAVDRLAGPEALGTGLAAATVGDVIGAGSGIMIPTSVPDPRIGNRSRSWHDRAALMETVWESQAGRLAEPFGNEVEGAAGALLFNATAADSGCRLLISQLALPGTATALPGSARPGCTGGEGFPASIDLLDPKSACPVSLRWSTAAMLSARFPIISPAGRIPAPEGNGRSRPRCDQGGYQVIDGGYSEGSGLGTLSDLWPALQRTILDHNACVLRGPSCTAASRDLVVPLVLYLQNAPGADAAPPQPRAAAEPVVPLVGLSAGKRQSAAVTWLQRLNQELDVCPSTHPADACTRATTAVRAALNGRAAVVVAPNSIPALVPPLGWSLSALSRKQLIDAMDVEAATTERNSTRPPAFGNLLRLLG